MRGGCLRARCVNAVLAGGDRAVQPLDAHAHRPVRTVAVIGGKGGCGTSVVATSLAVALGRLSAGVVLFDANLALGSVAPLLGLPASVGLPDVLAGRCALRSLMVPGPDGVNVIAAADGDINLSRLSQIDHASLIAGFSEPGLSADTLLVDTPSGYCDDAMGYASAAREVLVVVTDEPTALHDAARVLQRLHERYRARRFRVVVNRVSSARHGRDVHAELVARLDADTDLLLDHVGSIPDDAHVAAAVHARQSVVDHAPRSPAALAFAKLAARVAAWPRPATPVGRIEFFVERLVQAADPTLVRATA